MKMSDYPKGEWQQIWDGLFWRFMHTHRVFFIQNPRLSMLLASFDKMSDAKKQSHLSNADNFLFAL
jgi:deoxyribodipyrimidine photolyase-related protein